MSADAFDSLVAQARGIAAEGEMSIDREVYDTYGQDSLAPLLGGGAVSASVGVFGRDPGRHEIQWMEPLIGAGGQLVRAGVHRALFGCDPPDFDASREVSKSVFFSNTVPYKPVGNKAWSMKVKRRFQPIIASYLVDHWAGCDLITLGNVAFQWFALDKSREEAAPLRAFWERESRYEESLSVGLKSSVTGTEKTIHLHPLPHPSPLNARWYSAFPGLLDQRLKALGPL
ncbi:MAG: uracil-DNA glycosylase family protein [Myxococcota bacterium]|nr:uracil-DNA glycosylase family protein [Myxococcota bacterium]